MPFQIVDYQNSAEADQAIAALLIACFVDEGFTDRDRAAALTALAALRQRGQILLARASVSRTHDSQAAPADPDKILGMVILVQPASPARQVAQPDEAEIQLLAVHPTARGQGLAARLMKTCEQRALALGYRKLVLSTQPSMQAAHQVYERLAYRRNPTRDWQRTGGRSFLVYEKSLS